MVDANTTLSVSVGEDGVDTVEEFDDYFGGLEDTYSRAGRIKEAMAFYQAIHELTDGLDEVPDPDEMGSETFRHFVRQAILDRDRREAAGEV